MYVVVRGVGRMKLDDEFGAPSLGDARREDVDGRRDRWADES